MSTQTNTAEDNSSKTVPFDVIEEHKGKTIEIAFLSEASESMKPYFCDVKSNFEQIIKDVSMKYTDFALRIALAIYRDHADNNSLLECFDFSPSHKTASEFLDKITTFDCEDGAQAVADALNAVLKFSWTKNSIKLIVHFAYNGAHGQEFKNLSDNFENGCPCGLNYREILKSLNEKKVFYTVVSYSPYADFMTKKFSEYYLSIELVNALINPISIPNKPIPAFLKPANPQTTCVFISKLEIQPDNLLTSDPKPKENLYVVPLPEFPMVSNISFPILPPSIQHSGSHSNGTLNNSFGPMSIRGTASLGNNPHPPLKPRSPSGDFMVRPYQIRPSIGTITHWDSSLSQPLNNPNGHLPTSINASKKFLPGMMAKTISRAILAQIQRK